MKMRLFGELNCYEYEVRKICSGTWMGANNPLYEITMTSEGYKRGYLHFDQAQLKQLMSDAGVCTPMELIGCELIQHSSFNGDAQIAILPKGAHVELMVLDENGKELEVQFRQY